MCLFFLLFIFIVSQDGGRVPNRYNIYHKIDRTTAEGFKTLNRYITPNRIMLTNVIVSEAIVYPSSTALIAKFNRCGYTFYCTKVIQYFFLQFLQSDIIKCSTTKIT